MVFISHIIYTVFILNTGPPQFPVIPKFPEQVHVAIETPKQLTNSVDPDVCSDLSILKLIVDMVIYEKRTFGHVRPMQMQLSLLVRAV